MSDMNKVINRLLVTLVTALALASFAKANAGQNPTDFIPDNFVLFEKISGDLNKDGLDDVVLIIKDTDKKQIVQDEYRGQLDQNRRGLIILLAKQNGYQLALENIACFSSENEDGGVYFPPELFVSIKKGNLYINYGHGRYGHWQYTFRLQNTNFELIGYDQVDGVVVVQREVSINFLSKKKIEKVNTNENADAGEEVFSETVSKIKLDKRIRLTEIKDFDGLTIDY